MAPPSPVTLLTRPDLCKVEQVTYKCDFQQKKRIEHLPIDFRVQGKEGIKLADAVNLHFSNLEGRDDPMFTDQSIGNSVSCRMAVRGFCECSLYRYSIPYLISLRATPNAANQGRYGEPISLRSARGVNVASRS